MVDLCNTLSDKWGLAKLWLKRDMLADNSDIIIKLSIL
jgi:hypothetical protein